MQDNHKGNGLFSDLVLQGREGRNRRKPLTTYWGQT
jgi:hypothetical protein